MYCFPIAEYLNMSSIGKARIYSDFMLILYMFCVDNFVWNEIFLIVNA